jgi:hypothetical protein
MSRLFSISYVELHNQSLIMEKSCAPSNIFSSILLILLLLTYRLFFVSVYRLADATEMFL